jgi:hypothetical protein
MDAGKRVGSDATMAMFLMSVSSSLLNNKRREQITVLSSAHGKSNRK